MEHTIHFEPGIHPFTSGRVQDLVSRATHGDMTAHAWNDGVARRMRSYAPSLVAIDGYCAEGFDPSLNDVTDAMKQVVWVGLPGSPRAINGTEEVWVLAGDNAYEAAITAGGIARVIAGAMATMIAATITGHIAANLGLRLWDAKKQDPTAPPHYSRRQALKTLGSIATLAPFTIPGGSLGVASYSSDSNLSVACQRITEHTAPFMSLARIGIPRNSVDGRTALLIQKTTEVLSHPDTAQLLPSTTAAVLLGSGHLYHPTELLHSPHARARLIKRHTKDVIASIEEPGAKLPYGLEDIYNFTPQARIATVKNWQTGSHLYKVTEPTERDFRRWPVETISENVRFLGRVESPFVRAIVNSLS